MSSKYMDSIPKTYKISPEEDRQSDFKEILFADD